MDTRNSADTRHIGGKISYEDPNNHNIHQVTQERQRDRIAGWRSRLAILTAGGLVFLTLSGLLILFGPFNVPNQVNVIAHTALGLIFLVPCAWYLVRHLRQYWRSPLSHNLVLGYLGGAVVVLCAVSGIVLTWQAAFGKRIS